MVGTVVGNYVVTRLVGRGGMGAVYEAEHQFLGTRVAVKVLHGCFATDEEMARRFFHEARAALQIHHPGVVQVFDFGKLPDDTPYLIMELLEGAPLDEVVAHGPMAESAVAQLGAALADALAAAHAAGVVHRDLKPENIVLVGDGRVKVLDFGIAKFLSSLPGTKSGMVIGTPSYMAPEQASGSRGVTPRTDIYALGVILFEMLTGRKPFLGDTHERLIRQHLDEKPPRPSKLAPVSRDMEDLVLQCLAKDPADRPSRMGEIRDRLERIADPDGRTRGEKVSPRGSSARHRRGGVASVSLAVALALGGGGAYLLRPPARPSAVALRPDSAREVQLPPVEPQRRVEPQRAVGEGDAGPSRSEIRQTAGREPDDAKAAKQPVRGAEDSPRARVTRDGSGKDGGGERRGGPDHPRRDRAANPPRGQPRGAASPPPIDPDF